MTHSIKARAVRLTHSLTHTSMRTHMRAHTNTRTFSLALCSYSQNPVLLQSHTWQMVVIMLLNDICGVAQGDCQSRQRECQCTVCVCVCLLYRSVKLCQSVSICQHAHCVCAPVYVSSNALVAGVSSVHLRPTCPFLLASVSDLQARPNAHAKLPTLLC